MLTNILPYSQELTAEVLYERVLSEPQILPSAMVPQLNFTRIDIDEKTRAALAKIMHSMYVVNAIQSSGAEAGDVSPFIESSSMAIGWDGNISPCLPLLRSHTVFLFERKRFSRRHFMGNVTERGLKELWNMRAFVSFRERVQTFDFSLVFIMAAVIFLYQMKRLVSGMSFQPAGAVSGRRASYNIPEISKTTKVVRN